MKCLGNKLERLRLRKDAVPTLFNWDDQQTDKLANSKCPCNGKQPSFKNRKITKNTPIIICDDYHYIANFEEVSTAGNFSSNNCSDKIKDFKDNVTLHLEELSEHKEYNVSYEYPTIESFSKDKVHGKNENIDTNLFDFNSYIGQIFEPSITPYEEEVACAQDISFENNANSLQCTDRLLYPKFEHNYSATLKFLDKSTQVSLCARYNIEDMEDDPNGLYELTGLHSFNKFKKVFDSLYSKINYLRYTGNQARGGLSLENQLFLTLWKLRKNPTECELSRHFGISELEVYNIFRTWILLMVDQWSTSNIWPNSASTIRITDNKPSKSKDFGQTVNELKQYKILSKSCKDYIPLKIEISNICAALCNF